MSRKISADFPSTFEVLPLGWTTARIGEVLKLYNGAAFKPSQWSATGLPIIRIQNLNNAKARFNYFEGELNERFRVRKGDLLFAWSGTPGTSFGAHIWKGDDAWLNQHIFRIEFDPQLFDREFLRMAINRNLNAYIAEAHGGAGLAHITKGRFEAFEILLPPLAEQRRIVARLEALEARSRRAREKLEAVPAQLAQARQSLLAAAFRGDLTAEWRETERAPEWRTGTIDEICIESFYGPRFSDDDYTPEGIPTIRTTDFTDNGLIELRNTPRVIVPPDRREKFLLRSGDLLLTRTGSIGKMAIFRGDYEALHSAYLIRFRFNESVTPDFVFNCLSSPRWQALLGLNTTAVTQPNINAEAIRRLPIPLPPLPEQKEIVRRLTAVFAKLDAAATAHAAAVAELDRLDQSLLAHAFSGRLVPPEAAPSLAPVTPSVSVQAQLYLLRFIPALLRAAGQPVPLADLNAVVALRFLPAAVLLPVVERLGGAPARAHFAAAAPVAYEDGAFLAVMQRLRQAGAIVVSPGRRGIPSLSLGPQPPPGTATIDADARHLAPLLSRVPIGRVEPILRRLQSAEVQEALLSPP